MKRLLNIELIPKTSWYKNVRSAVPKKVWQEIRALYVKRVCQYCGTQHDLALHEVWQYDDEHHVQRLMGFETVCFLCHLVHHIGYAGILIEQGVVTKHDIVNQYCVVNQCTEKDFTEDSLEAIKLWEVRSTFQWLLDLTYLEREAMPKLTVAKDWIRTHPDEVKRILDKEVRL